MAAAAKKPVDANLTRKEMLQKWKKERDIKKTLEKEKSKKPMFKVCKVVAEKKPTNLSTSRTQKNPAFKRTEVSVSFSNGLVISKMNFYAPHRIGPNFFA